MNVQLKQRCSLVDFGRPLEEFSLCVKQITQNRSGEWGVGRGSEVVRIWNGVTAVPVEKAGYVWKRLRKNEGQWVEEK